MFFIEYFEIKHGWATCKISNGNIEEIFGVSYLNDSLKELAESAKKAKKGEKSKVVFMEEPGEIVLELIPKIKEIEYSLTHYKDWNNHHNSDKGTVFLTGKVKINTYVNTIRDLLKKILDENGEDGYIEKWINHQFPMNDFLEL